jgi:hypothetical protein|tara:strand:+ start:6171 stop:6776 length:606 start_codon:yes stop_codon:yes gene_type:complete
MTLFKKNKLKKEEQKFWKEFKLVVKVIGGALTLSYRVYFKRNESYSYFTMDFSINVFHNCQTITVGSGFQFQKIPYFAIERLLMILTFRYAHKPQLVLDLNITNTEEVIAKLEPFAKSIQQLPYNNSNGSEMCFVIVKLDLTEEGKLLQAWNKYSTSPFSEPDIIDKEGAVQKQIVRAFPLPKKVNTIENIEDIMQIPLIQ